MSPEGKVDAVHACSDLAVGDASSIGIDNEASQAVQSDDFPGAAFISTRRLLLRGLRLADIPSLQAMNADAQVSRALVEPCPTDYFGVAKTVFNANAHYIKRPGLGVWHTNDVDGEFVGVFALMPIEASDEVELGARLRRAAWGRLYSIEGSRALIEHAFATVGLPKLVGLCHPDNKAVPLILRRLCFRSDGETVHFGHRALRFVLDSDAWHKRGATRHNRIAPARAAADTSE